MYVAWAPFFSGAERALQILVQHLDRSRYRPVVAVGTEGHLAESFRSLNVPTVHIPIAYTGLRTLASSTASIARLAWFARREGAALIHSNDVPSFQPAGYAARLLNRPIVTHVRFPDNAAGFGWFLRPGFARALFVSDALRQDALSQAPGVFDDRSEVLYDGVHIPELASDAERWQIRDELSLPHDRILVVMAGQVAEIKGIWDYLDAIRILRARDVPASFVVLGDDMKTGGAVRREAEARAAAAGLTSVHFLGFRPNAQRLIPAFDIVAVPSHIEPLGNATLEAMASARPVIGSRVGGIPEMVVDGTTGMLVPPRAPEALAAAIETLVRNPERARQMGDAGRARALEVFSIPRHVSSVASLYDRLLA